MTADTDTCHGRHVVDRGRGGQLITRGDFFERQNHTDHLFSLAQQLSHTHTLSIYMTPSPFLKGLEV